jgi:hypothetical protein
MSPPARPPAALSAMGRDTDGVTSGAVHHLPACNRHFALDERGVGLRATWHFERGFLNLSLWSGDRCVETFHMTPAEAARFVGFVATGLAEAVREPAGRPSPLTVVDEPPAAPTFAALSERVRSLRQGIADALDRASTRLRT